MSYYELDLSGLQQGVEEMEEQIGKLIDLNVETLFVHPITINHLSIMVSVYYNKKENK